MTRRLNSYYCRRGCYSIPWNVPLYPWSLPYYRVLSMAASSTIFESLVWLDLGLNPGPPDHTYIHRYFKTVNTYIHTLYTCITYVKIVNTYVYTSLPTYIHECIHSYITYIDISHTYIHIYITYIHTYIKMVNTFISYIHTHIHYIYT